MTGPTPADLANRHVLLGHEVTYRERRISETRVESFEMDGPHVMATLGKTYDGDSDLNEFECLNCNEFLDAEYTEEAAWSL